MGIETHFPTPWKKKVENEPYDEANYQSLPCENTSTVEVGPGRHLLNHTSGSWTAPCHPNHGRIINSHSSFVLNHHCNSLT